MRRSARAVLAGLLGVGVGACANIWGFAELTSENRDGAADSGATVDDAGDEAGDGTRPSGDAAEGASDAGSGGCNLASNSVCRGRCVLDASPCGCLPDTTTQATYCGVAGSGNQGTNCSSDLDCAPGYGCMMTTGTCAHWCRPTTTCPTGTTCQNNPMVTYNGEVFKYCY
jgi:hypothetical protein